MVIVKPGRLATAIHIRDGAMWLTVSRTMGQPLTFILIRAPISKSPSIPAACTGPPGHSAGFVQTLQTASTEAEQPDDPSNECRWPRR